ncbi:hypothetical protein NMG60_11017589 [Bertholletia excelsa]
MNRQLLPHIEINPAFLQQWELDDIHNAFFKCTRWQLEETLDPVYCPYHYFCSSTYPGNYPPVVDILLLALVAISYWATLVLTLIQKYGATCHVSRCYNVFMGGRWATISYLVPSGPITLPLILLALAKGHRIATAFPVSAIGPSVLQLILISALAHDTGYESDIRYTFYKASTISGILHASVYVDSAVLPYYTGLDALLLSTFSGECMSCVCRKDTLVVGGKLVAYRGWSATSFSVVGALCLRMICRLFRGEKMGKVTVARAFLENLGWIFIARDCVYLIASSHLERNVLGVAVSSCVLVLICLEVVRKVCTWTKHWAVYKRCDSSQSIQQEHRSWSTETQVYM